MLWHCVVPDKDGGTLAMGTPLPPVTGIEPGREPEIR
jgi:hypothetical protein